MRNIFTLLLITFCIQSYGQGLWYRDNDRDGFGDPNFPTFGVFIPPGFVADNTDCDDFNFYVKPDNIWYKDADYDGYTDGTFVRACYQPAGYVNIARIQLDCFDNDPKLNYITWYTDEDGDGYIPNVGYIETRETCEDLRGKGYTQDIYVKGKDCNDNDPNIYIVESYLDNDGDGFPAAGGLRKDCGETPLPPYYLASELNSLTVDCDDSDLNNIPTTVWFEDQDNDGYSSGVSIVSCEQPIGFIMNPFRDGLTLLVDCNDKNAVQKPNQAWYEDNDGDGYGKGLFDGGIINQGCERPKGNWFAISELIDISDCNDNVASVNPTTQWVKDGDGDGYYTGDKIIQCSSPGPGYLVATTQLPGDCNDYNTDINPKTLWVLDADGDGYTAPLYFPSPEGSCTPPQDGGNYIYNPKGRDCDDNDATYNPETVWVKDADGDGYYVGEPYIGCFVIFQPGYVRKTNQQPGDCDDVNPSVNPGAVEICRNGIDDNCNGSIDEGTCEQCKNATALRTTNITATGATLEWSAITNPDQWLIQYKTTKKGTKWVNVFVTGNKRSVTLYALQSNQTYAWRIQAQCDKRLTDYTSEVAFKTASISATVEARTYEKVESSTFEVITTPNPSDSYFTLTVKSSNTTDRILVRVMDELGRVVEQKENVMSGTSIRFGDKYIPGMYFIMVQQGRNSKAVKLIRQ